MSENSLQELEQRIKKLEDKIGAQEMLSRLRLADEKSCTDDLKQIKNDIKDLKKRVEIIEKKKIAA